MMKNMLKTSFILCVAALACAFTYTLPNEEPTAKAKVEWYTWEEAVEANKTNPKKFVVDIYTGWCGWCKVMDKKTFSNAKVAEYMNDNFYAIKLDAEQREDIIFNEHTFKFVKGDRGRGVHTLAYSLLDGKMSYPSIVFLDEQVQRIMISKGFKDSKDFMKDLKFDAEEKYKDK
ncbi:MAG: DUF255 domain-containing protein [Bacteroidota bacterium]